MEQFFAETFGLSENIFAYVVLPLLIFLARVLEVSVNTVRIIYMLGGRKYTSTILGFFEAFIWLIAMRQIFQHLDNWLCLFMYAGGFAAGIFVGMMIEERIAYGKVIVRIITQNEVAPLIQFLSTLNFQHTKVRAEGPKGVENLIFTVLEREHLDGLIKKLKEILPKAFYTVENVKAAGENGMVDHSRKGLNPFSWLRGVIRF